MTTRDFLFAIGVLLSGCSSGRDTCDLKSNSKRACVCATGSLGFQACQANGTYAQCACEVGQDMAVVGKRVFVTRTAYSADLRAVDDGNDAGIGASGLVGADSLCNAAAAAAHLGGTFSAWLSDSSHSALHRITGTGPWYLTDGINMAFSNLHNLSTTPLVAVDRDENGYLMRTADGGTTGVWTGTGAGGGSTGRNCSNWTVWEDPTGRDGPAATATVGSLGRADGWTDSAAESDSCDGTNHLYCFEE